MPFTYTLRTTPAIVLEVVLDFRRDMVALFAHRCRNKGTMLRETHAHNKAEKPLLYFVAPIIRRSNVFSAIQFSIVIWLVYDAIFSFKITRKDWNSAQGAKQTRVGGTVNRVQNISDTS